MHKCFICGNNAPRGFGFKGFGRDKPAGKRGYIWACADHIADARLRKEKAETK